MQQDSTKTYMRVLRSDAPAEGASAKDGVVFRAVVPAVIGALSVFAFSPFFVWPVILAVYACLYRMVARADTVGQAALTGGCFAAGLLCVNFYWGFPMARFYFGTLWPGHEIAVFAASVAIICVFFAGTVIAYVVAMALYRRFAPSGFAAPWVFAGLVTGVELLRGVPFANGFPWGLTGYAFAGDIYMMQLASVGGVWLMTFLALGCAACFADLKGRSVSAAALVLVAWWWFGFLRLYGAPSPVEVDNVASLRLVQGEIDNADRTDTGGAVRAFNFQLGISKNGSDDSAKTIIWPESAVMLFLDENRPVLHEIGKLAGPDGEVVTGSLDRQSDPEAERVFNVTARVTGDGEIVETVRKRILVPFGEYMPLEGVFGKYYSRYLREHLTYVPGTDAPVLHTRHAGRAMVLNCYEFLFPGHVAHYAKDADYLLHLSNSDWFGDTIAVEQMFYMSRLRAVENGLSYAGVSNAGMTGVIDGYGRIRMMARPGFPGMYDVEVPVRLKGRTVWSVITGMFYR